MFLNVYIDKILSRSGQVVHALMRKYGKMDVKGAIWERPKPRKLRTS